MFWVSLVVKIIPKKYVEHLGFKLLNNNFAILIIQLRYSKRKFLSLEPNPYLCQIAFMAGIAIGAASKGILVLSDDIPSSIAIRYALLLAPTINPYIMFVCPDYLNLHITNRWWLHLCFRHEID